jgi:hypothetical protein
MFVEKYFSLLTKDIADCEEALTQPMPEQIRRGLEDELRRLQSLNEVLSGSQDKSALHQARARLRWARQRLAEERDAVRKKKIETEIHEIESDIKREMDRRERS